MSVLTLGEMLKDNPTFRVDSEFFRKELLSIPRFAKRLGDSAFIKSGTTPPDRDDELTHGVVLLKTTDIRNSVLASEGGAEYYHISPEIAARMKETQLCAEDVLLNIVGATTDVVGRVSFVPDGFPKANITQAMALLRVHDPEIKPGVLFAFLAGRYGALQIKRLARPTGQYNLNLQEVASLRIPFFSTNFSEAVTQHILTSHALMYRCSAYQKQAEQTLLHTLGLENWQPLQPLTYTRRASEAHAAKRLDAEHFQPKYDAMLEQVTQHAAYTRRLADFALYCDRGEQPDYVEDGTLDVVNSRHILENGLDYNSFEKTDLQCLNDARFAKARIQKNDILVYTTGAKIGRSGIYFADTPALASNHVNILRVAEENPLYVGAVMNSMIGRWQTRRQCTGSAQVEIYPADIASFVIPFVDAATQETIAKKMRQSHAARREAQASLEVAKRAVEIAIEQDENAALDWLLKMTSAKAIQPDG